MPARQNNTRRSAQHSTTVSTRKTRQARSTGAHSTRAAAKPSSAAKSSSAAKPAHSAHIIQVNTKRFSQRIKEAASDEPTKATKSTKEAKPTKATRALRSSSARPSAAEKKRNQEAKSPEQLKAEARAEEKAAKQKAKNKAKADKKFDKLYGGGQGDGKGAVKGVGAKILRVLGKADSAAASEGDCESGGPRAAIYKGEAVSPKEFAQKITLKFSRPLFALGLIIFICYMLYTPAQQYYLQMRETSRLQAEYLAVSERNNALASDIKRLETDEGIEDRAHQDLGYIKRGESTASIKGIDFTRKEELQSNVPPGSIPAPVTWYSPVLDFIFGY